MLQNTGVLVSLLICSQGVQGFSKSVHTRSESSRRWLTTFLNSKGVDFDDFASIGDASSDEGEQLAKQFYKQLRDREETAKPDRTPELLSEEEARQINRDAFRLRTEVPTRKFTGRRDELPPSAGLFSGQGASVYSVPSPRQRMAENEFNLVGRAERLALVQTSLTVFLLVVGIFVGVTGGISSNDWSAVIDSLDTSIEGIEEALPIPTDDATSVWL